MLYLIFISLAIISLMLIAIHIGFIPPRIIETKSPRDFAMDYEAIDILTAKNKKLFSWFISSSESSPLIVIMHGWGSNSEHMLPFASIFHKAGLNVLLVDARCHGQSDADTYSALPRFAEDIEYAVEYAKKSLKFNDQIIILGHSVGAGAALYAASKRNDITAVIGISAFANPQWLMTRYFQSFKLPGFLISFFLFYIQFVIGHKFTEIAPLNTIKKLTIPALLVHGADDKTVPIEDAYAIQKNNKNGNLLIVDQADHDSVDKIESHGHFLLEFLADRKVISFNTQ